MDCIFLFPGQGSQKVGMTKDLYDTFVEYRHTVEEASDILKINMAELLFEDPGHLLSLTEYTQPILLMVSVGMMRLLKAQNINSMMAAGHSLGEYSALVAQEGLTFEEALRTVRFRGQQMQKAVPVGVGGMMAFIGSDVKKAIELAQDISKPTQVVEAVNFNMPTQVVFSGHKIALDLWAQEIKNLKLGKIIPLSVSAPFHSSLMRSASEAMADWLQDIVLKNLKFPVVANCDGSIYKTYSKNLLVEQVDHPVLWTKSIENIIQEVPQGVFIEVGFGNTLQSFLSKINTDKKCLLTGNIEQLNQTFSYFS